MTRPTDEQLEDLARLEAGATPGDWYAFFQAGAGGRADADVSASDADGTFKLATVTSGSVEQCDRDRNYVIALRNFGPAMREELRLLRALAHAMESLDAACTGEASAAVAGTLLAWQRWKHGKPPP